MAVIKNKTKQKIISIGEDEGKLEPLCIASGNIKQCNCYGKQHGLSSEKPNTELPHDPAILVRGIHPNKLKA